jgi:hypothetical protein
MYLYACKFILISIVKCYTLKIVCFVDLMMQRCDAKFLKIGNICIEMEFGCLQDIVVKLIILKCVRYEIIWSKISCYF